MKKIIISCFILIFIATSLISCNHNNVPDKPNIDNNITYESYVNGATNSIYSVKHETNYWSSTYWSKKDNMESKSVDVLGTKYSAPYHESRIDYLNSFTTDHYYGSNVRFGMRSDTGELVYIIFTNSDYLAIEKKLEDKFLTYESVIPFATEIASNFVDNISEYTIYKEEPRVYDGVTDYIINFIKVINGFYSSDYISIKVTSKGELMSIFMGDIGAFDDLKINIDKTAVEKNITEKLMKVYTRDNYENKDYSLEYKEHNFETQRLAITPDGKYCISSIITIWGYNYSGEETDTEISLITIIGQ